jgi:tyrosine-protein phosphatase SIW14
MNHSLRTLLGVALVFVLIAAPVAWALRQRGEMRGFKVVREGVLYRSGQMSLDALKRQIHDRDIRTVVCLRDAVPGRPSPDRTEEEYCLKQGIRYVRIPPRHWEAADGTTPADEGVRTFLEIMADTRNHPVLIHCFAGVHRTGAYCAVYRMEFEGWSNEEAIAELKDLGYAHLEEEWDILNYLERYQPRLRNRTAAGPGLNADLAGAGTKSLPASR